MERNFARIFYIDKENFWGQESPEGGTWVGTTHQGAPAPPRRNQVGAAHLMALLTLKPTL